MIQIKLLKVRGKAAVVTLRDKDGMLQGRVISRDNVLGLRIGETKGISQNVVDTGTEYGIDVEVLLGEEYVITPQDLEQELRRHGIWTYDDLNSNSQEVVAAINTLTKKLYAALLREARITK